MTAKIPRRPDYDTMPVMQDYNEPPDDLIVRIPGLKPTGEPDCYRIEGIKVVPIRLEEQVSALVKAMQDQDVDSRDIDSALEAFDRALDVARLTRILAERITVVRK